MTHSAESRPKGTQFRFRGSNIDEWLWFLRVVAGGYMQVDTGNGRLRVLSAKDRDALISRNGFLRVFLADKTLACVAKSAEFTAQRLWEHMSKTFGLSDATGKTICATDVSQRKPRILSPLSMCHSLSSVSFAMSANPKGDSKQMRRHSSVALGRDPRYGTRICEFLRKHPKEALCCNTRRSNKSQKAH